MLLKLPNGLWIRPEIVLAVSALEGEDGWLMLIECGHETQIATDCETKEEAFDEADAVAEAINAYFEEQRRPKEGEEF